MSTGTPTLGYASRTAAVLALLRNGNSTRQIADKIGISPKNVTDVIYSASRSRSLTPKPFHAATGQSILLTNDVLRALRPYAAKRGMTVTHLARIIVETVADEKMVDAVMDDGA